MSNQPGQGRYPKPSTIRNRNEQDAYLHTPAKLPPAPRHFTDAEKQVWWRVGVELIQARLITQIDMDVLAQYCRAYCRSVEAFKRLENERWVIMTASGSEKKNPLFDIAKDADAQVDRLARELGMTPAARTKLPKRKGEGGPRQASPSAAKPSGSGTDPRKLTVVK